MRHIILLTLLLLLPAFASATESVRAMQFFSITNNIAFPDEVGNKAYYTNATDPSGKELRVTTNVASAVYSMVSGLLERHSWIGDIYGGWSWHGIDRIPDIQWNGGYYETIDEFYDACKTKDIVMYSLYPPLSTAYQYAEDRSVSTYRISPSTMMRISREELIAMAENKSRYYEDGYGTIVPCKISSTYLMITENHQWPNWSWTNQVVHTLFPRERWSIVLPTLFSAPNDDVWKDRDYGAEAEDIAFGYAYEPMLFFAYWLDEHHPDYVGKSMWDAWIFDDIRPAVYGNRSDITLYDAIISPFLPEDFTNDTWRLSYGALGVLQKCVEGINLSYEFDTAYDFDLEAQDLWYTHRRMSKLKEQIVEHGLEERYDQETGEYKIFAILPSLENDWEREEVWEIVTNRIENEEFPLILCSGDFQHFGAEVFLETDSFELSYKDVYELIDSGISTLTNIQAPTLTLNGSEIIISFDWAVYYMLSVLGSVKGSASVTREARLRQTVGMDTNSFPYISRPAQMAFTSGILKQVGLQDLQTRYVWNNPTFMEDADGGYWRVQELGTGTIVRAETRSSSPVWHTDYHGLTNGWADSILALNSTIKTITPYAITPKESFLPITLNALQTLENAATGGNDIQIDWHSDISTINISLLDDSAIELSVERMDGIGETVRLTQGDSFRLGRIAGSESVTNAPAITPRHPFAVGTEAAPLLYNKWQFNSIRESYNN